LFLSVGTLTCRAESIGPLKPVKAGAQAKPSQGQALVNGFGLASQGFEKAKAGALSPRSSV